jgi:hypothetical protein
MIESEPEDLFFDYYGNVSLKDNFTIYFNSIVYSYSVDMAMDLLQQVNRNIAITELQYPELSGLNYVYLMLLKIIRTLSLQLHQVKLLVWV